MKNIFLCENNNTVLNVYGSKTVENISGEGHIYNKEYLINNPDKFKNTEFVFSTWGMPKLSEEEIKHIFPDLKCVFYAAGTVQAFAKPFLNCGVRVFSAWAANAVPVAEYTLAQILLANTGFFHRSQLMSMGKVEEAHSLASNFSGNFNVTVGIIGAGAIGKKVIELLKPFKIKTVVFDPFLSDENAAALGTKKVSLEELFLKCDVISNHLADNQQTKNILNYDLFSSLRPYTTFINTGRGAQVVETDLARLLSERPDVFALLDVTYPEPPKEGHLFYKLSNCILTPHIAGSKGNEVRRMAEYMIEEYKKFVSGEPCCYEVTEKMLETMA